jgi:NAD(P)-dependent dehydrogenase (short-subunit alcohol dehydrogenase family)
MALVALTSSETHASRTVVIGSSGGIGAALADRLGSRGCMVARLSRSQPPGTDANWHPIDIRNEDSIAAAAELLKAQAPFQKVIVATGLLHDDDLPPERALRDLDQTHLMRLFVVNAIGPALVAKHFIPLLPRDGRCIFTALSARVGSIGDNRLGGWYGYRASKAALNMFIKTLSIELARTRPEAICVGLHPGTVDTNLSKPYQRGIAPDRLFSPAQAAGHLLDVLAGLTTAHSGRCLAWDGNEIAP